MRSPFATFRVDRPRRGTSRRGKSILEAVGTLMGVSLTVLVVLVIYGASTNAAWFLRFSDIFGQGPAGAAKRLDAAARYDFQHLPSLCTTQGYKLLCVRNALAFLGRESGEQIEYSLRDVQGDRAEVVVITRNNPPLTLRMMHEDGKWKLDDFRSGNGGKWMSARVDEVSEPAEE